MNSTRPSRFGRPSLYLYRTSCSGPLSIRKKILPRALSRLGQPWLSTDSSSVLPLRRRSSGVMSCCGGNTERISASSPASSVSLSQRMTRAPPAASVRASAVLNSIMMGIGTLSGCASSHFLMTWRHDTRVLQTA